MPAHTTAITIGSFDGVHLGHAALVQRCRQRVGTPGRVIAMAFDPHPMTLLRPDHAPPRLTHFDHRRRLLLEAGADDVVKLDPARILSISARDFLAGICADHSPAHIIAGDDFHFGRGREGNVAYLARVAPEFGFHTEVLDPVEVALGDDLIVRASSTMVRWLIRHGRVSDATRVLGRPYSISGTVVPGDRRGRTVGFPTANLATDLLFPADGVYACRARLSPDAAAPDTAGPLRLAAVNVGSRPTVNGTERRIEVHLLNPDGTAADLSESIPGEYGWPLTIEFVAWIRDQLRFPSFDALVSQLPRDVERCLLHLNSPPRPTHQSPSHPVLVRTT